MAWIRLMVVDPRPRVGRPAVARLPGRFQGPARRMDRLGHFAWTAAWSRRAAAWPWCWPPRPPGAGAACEPAPDLHRAGCPPGVGRRCGSSPAARSVRFRLTARVLKGARSCVRAASAARSRLRTAPTPNGCGSPPSRLLEPPVGRAGPPPGAALRPTGPLRSNGRFAPEAALREKEEAEVGPVGTLAPRPVRPIPARDPNAAAAAARRADPEPVLPWICRLCADTSFGRRSSRPAAPNQQAH